MTYSYIDILLLGIALSMDAFAVSVCKGIFMQQINYRQSALIALFFGGFQALMPLVGYFLGNTFAKSIAHIDHWISFFLLAYIGGKMIFEVARDDKSGKKNEVFECLDIKELFMLAIATSIDALAVGITFSFADTNIYENISIIGITTLIISFSGVIIGNKFGSRYKTRAEIAGGIILIILGIKILIEGLGII